MLSTETRSRIDALLEANRVVLFMKGTRHAPKCGFSAGTAGLLNELLDDYATIDVLEDPALREGIKTYGNWPTIPQLYVDKELVGGADIVQSMYNSGELHGLFGLAKPDRTPPAITITPAAAEAIAAGLEDAGDNALHLSIDGRFQAQFFLRPAAGDEIRASSGGIEILFDVASAQRARGIVVDWVESMQGSGLSISNPNAPKAVQPLSVGTLKTRLDRGDITVIDVRPAADRALAPFAAARVLDEDSLASLSALAKDTPLAFLCHHGNSSRGAAEHFRGLGFKDVYNVDGGIDAWSTDIDASVPRY